MAGSILIPLKAIFDDKGIRDATKQFSKLGKSVLGAIGVTTSFAGITVALEQATKAAVSDVKSQQLLATQLKNTIGATDEAIASSEAFIKSLMLQTSIADDQLRPALSTLVRATGDLGSAQQLLSLSTDIAAGTGKDLSSVSLAVGKAAAGQTTALFRLIPSLKGSSDWAAEAQRQFAGMAETAANNDPYQQMNIILGELQETVGMALLPSLQNLSAWLSAPGTQASIEYLISKFNEFVTSLQNVVDGANYVGQALTNVLNIDPTLGKKAWDGFFNGIQESALKLLFGPAYPLFKALGILGGAAPKAAKSTFTPTVFTPTEFTPVGTTGAKGTTTSKADKAAAALKKLQDKVKAENKALKDAYDDQLKLYNAEVEALADIKKNLSSVASATAPLSLVTREIGEFEQSAISAFQSISDTIDSTLGSREGYATAAANLKAYAKTESALLIQLGRQRDEIAKKRSLAETLIADVKSVLTGSGNLANLLESQTKTVTNSVTKIVNGFTVTTKQTIEEVVGAKGVVGRLQDVVAKTKAFAAQLSDLKRAGLSPDLFKQIVEAGPDVGGQLATEILAGGADSVQALNTTFAELQAVAGTVAEQTAVVMYNSGTEVAGGLVNGLLAQEQALVDAAKTLADAFTAEFNARMGAIESMIQAPTVPIYAPIPTVVPKVTNVTNKIAIKATPATKKDAEKIVAQVFKYGKTSGGVLLRGGR